MEDASKGVPVGHMSSGNNVGRDCTSRCRSRACAAKSVVENVRLSVSQSSQSHAGSCHKGFESAEDLPLASMLTDTHPILVCLLVGLGKLVVYLGPATATRFLPP